MTSASRNCVPKVIRLGLLRMCGAVQLFDQSPVTFDEIVARYVMASYRQLAGLVALAICTPHPDIPWTKSNTLPYSIRRTVCASMHWNVPDVWQLLENDRSRSCLRARLG